MAETTIRTLIDLRGNFRYFGQLSDAVLMGKFKLFAERDFKQI